MPLSLNRDTMTYRPTITSYRYLPPRIRIIYPQGSPLESTDRYLLSVDKTLADLETRSAPLVNDPDDLVSRVFANQTAIHASGSYQLGRLIVERYQLARKHLADIQWRLEEMLERKPLRLAGPGFLDDKKLTDVERSIHDLERLKRDVQLNLWRDVVDLRKELITARLEYRATKSRMSFLIGGVYGGYG